jgi:hypothetical protein
MSSDIAYVAFCNDDGPHWWSWALHPEIKHCYVVLPTHGDWLALGKARNGIELKTFDDITDVVQNDILIKSKIHRPKRGLFMLNTCVGHTKQVLGINKPFIWTPYQLFKYLEKQNVGTS